MFKNDKITSTTRRAVVQQFSADGKHRASFFKAGIMKAILLMLCLVAGVSSFGQAKNETRISKQEFAAKREKLVEQVRNKQVQEADNTYLELCRIMADEVNALEQYGGSNSADIKKKELLLKKNGVFNEVILMRFKMEKNISGLDGKLKEYELTIL